MATVVYTYIQRISVQLLLGYVLVIIGLCTGYYWAMCWLLLGYVLVITGLRTGYYWAKYWLLPYAVHYHTPNKVNYKVEFRYSGSKLSLMQRIALCYIVLLS